MKRLVPLLAAFVLAAPASAAIRITVVVKDGDSVPGGRIHSPRLLAAARGGVFLFDGLRSGSYNPTYLYRFRPGMGVEQLAAGVTSQGVSTQEAALGDDGTAAWVSKALGTCQIVVAPLGGTGVPSSPCGDRHKLSSLDSTAGVAVVDGTAYVLGWYDPAPPDVCCGSGMGVFTASGGLVAPLTYPTWQGAYDRLDPRFQSSYGMRLFGAGSLYVRAGYPLSAQGALYRIGMGGGVTPVIGFGSPNPVAGSQPSFGVGARSILYTDSAGAYVVTGTSRKKLDCGRAGCVVAEASGDVVGVPTRTATGGWTLGRLERVGGDGALQPVVGVGSVTTDGSKIVALTGSWASPRKPDGSLFLGATIEKQAKIAQAIVSVSDSCALPKAVKPFRLTAAEKRDVRADQRKQEADYVALLKRAIAALEADTEKRPAHKARNQAALKKLRALLAAAARKAPRSLESVERTAQDAHDILENAKCSWLDDAEKDFKKEAKGVKDMLELGTTLHDLRNVLNGKATQAEKDDLLRQYLITLSEKLGDEKVEKLTGKTLELYDVLRGEIGKKDPVKTVGAEIAELAKLLGGKKREQVAELTTHLTNLVRVLDGSLEEDEQFDVLKETVASLATRMSIEGLEKVPQIRAFLLGMDIGKPFGARIAAELKLIASRTLMIECMTAIALAQGKGTVWGDVDITQATRATVPKHEKPSDKYFEYGGWNCALLDNSVLPGYPGHALVEATSPVNRYVFGLITTGGKSVYFDPGFLTGS